MISWLLNITSHLVHFTSFNHLSLFVTRKVTNLRGKETEHPLTYDGHERVKVADVEAFACHVDEELDDSSSVFLLHRLLTK